MRVEGSTVSVQVATLLAWMHRSARHVSQGATVLPKHVVQVLVGLSSLPLSWQSNLRVRGGAQAAEAAIVRLASFSPSDLAATTAALGDLQLALPVRSAYLTALEGCATHERLATLPPRAVANMLVGLAKLASAPPSFAIASGAGTRNGTGVEQGALSAGDGGYAYAASPPTGLLISSSAPLLVAVRLLRSFERSGFDAHSPADLARILRALAALKTPPSISMPVLYAVCGVLEGRVSQLEAAPAADVVVGLAYFMPDLRLPSAFLDALAVRVATVLPGMGSEEVLSVAAAWPGLMPHVTVGSRGVCDLVQARAAELVSSLDVWAGMALVNRAAALHKLAQPKERHTAVLRAAVQAHVGEVWSGLSEKERRKAVQMCQLVGATAPAK